MIVALTWVYGAKDIVYSYVFIRSMGAKFGYFRRISLFRGGGVNSLNCEIQRRVSDSVGEYLLASQVLSVRTKPNSAP